MTGERGLHGDFRRLAITDFADHHHVRILAQNRPQTTGKGHVHLRIDRHLADARQVIFDGVFDGKDVARLVVQAAQRGVQTGGLAGAGGPGDQQDAVGFAEQFAQGCQGAVRHAQALQFEAPGLFVEQAQYHSFTVRRWQGRDPHVHFMPGQPQGHAAILGHALFRDIQPRHDLDPRHQQCRQFTPWPEHFAQLPIDAHAHRQVLLEGFQVHIRGLFAYGFAEQRIDQANDRRIALLLQQVSGLRHLIHQTEQVQVVIQPLSDLFCRALTFAVRRRQSFGKHWRWQQSQRQFPTV